MSRQHTQEVFRDELTTSTELTRSRSIDQDRVGAGVSFGGGFEVGNYRVDAGRVAEAEGTNHFGAGG